MLLLPLTVHDLRLFAVGLFVAGVFLAPTTIVAFQLLDDLAVRGTQTEAQSWLQSAVVFGVAAGASLAGWAVDVRGPAAAFGSAPGWSPSPRGSSTCDAGCWS
jgi:predicted MFS family arabinose efflux permease